MHLIYMCCWIFLAIALSFLTKRLIQKVFDGGSYRYFMFPGILAYQISYGFGCLLSGATITQMRLLAREDIEHSDSPIPLLGPSLIAVAPIVGCSLLLLWATHILGTQFPDAGQYLQHSYQANTEGFFSFAKNYIDLLHFVVKKAFLEPGWSWQLALFVFLTLNFCIGMGPSVRNFKYSLLGLGLIWGLLFLVDAISLRMNWKYRLGGEYFLQFMWTFTAFFVTILSISLLFMLLAFGMSSILRAMRGQDSGPILDD